MSNICIYKRTQDSLLSNLCFVVVLMYVLRELLMCRGPIRYNITSLYIAYVSGWFMSSHNWHIFTMCSHTFPVCDGPISYSNTGLRTGYYVECRILSNH